MDVCKKGANGMLGYLIVRRYIYDHDCLLNTTHSCYMQASSRVIGCCLINDFRFMPNHRSIPKVIIHKARTNLGVNIGYQKA